MSERERVGRLNAVIIGLPVLLVAGVALSGFTNSIAPMLIFWFGAFVFFVAVYPKERG